MEVAKVISTFSYCERKKVGAILVQDRRIIATGYNGTPRGGVNRCEDCEGNTLPDVLHAESNAITQCAAQGMKAEGGTLYVTLSPCRECAKLIIQSGITKVIYSEEYRDHEGIELLKKYNVCISKL